MGKLRVLVACEYSGRVREAFRKLGHDAWSCDLLPAEDNSPYHTQGDVRGMIGHWDLMIAHPPCTYLSNSGVCHLSRDPSRMAKMHQGALFFKQLMDAPIPHIAIENPIQHGHATKIIGRRQNQVIQPWMFGHTEQKATCLWLKNLPPLQPTDIVKVEMMALPKNKRERLHYLSPGPDRWKERSRTYQGIADAMAEQWSVYIIDKQEKAA
jgi:hypothetical protein